MSRMIRSRRNLAAAVLTGLALAVTAWVQTPTAPLPSVFPAGALLTVESKNFAAQLADWNASEEKSDWLGGDNYAVFSRSKLFIRLREAQGEITQAAGLPTLDTADLLTAIAGERSALAIYDIGELRFLYMTEMPRAEAIQNALWQARADFEPRNAAGQPFFVRSSQETGREIAFAVVDDRFLLSTSADLLAGSLELLGGGASTVAAEAWYQEATAEAASVGDVRMVYNMRTLARTSHFRSYWIPQNITELSAFRSGVVDIDRSTEEIRERRVLLREETSEAGAGESRATALARLAPPAAGFFRASARPSTEEAVTLLREKLLAPSGPDGMRNFSAPSVSAEGIAGSESQLETHIDQAPPKIQRAEFDAGVLGELFAAQELQASLLVYQGSADAPWPGHRAAVALESSGAWPQGETLAAIARSASGLWTMSGVGASWAQDGEIYQMSGLKPLFAALDGGLLVVADDRALLEAILARRSQPTLKGEAAVIAEWRRSGLQQPSEALFRRLEHQSGGGYRGPGREPDLFSENIASLSRALDSVISMRIERTEQPDRRLESVRYELD